MGPQQPAGMIMQGGPNCLRLKEITRMAYRVRLLKRDAQGT